eukprot:scaffold1006_cov270-Pinguiococcus_pyrenoidosus.AAC.13
MSCERAGGSAGVLGERVRHRSSRRAVLLSQGDRGRHCEPSASEVKEVGHGRVLTPTSNSSIPLHLCFLPSRSSGAGERQASIALGWAQGRKA